MPPVNIHSTSDICLCFHLVLELLTRQQSERLVDRCTEMVEYTIHLSFSLTISNHLLPNIVEVLSIWSLLPRELLDLQVLISQCFQVRLTSPTSLAVSSRLAHLHIHWTTWQTKAKTLQTQTLLFSTVQLIFKFELISWHTCQPSRLAKRDMCLATASVLSSLSYWEQSGGGT